MARTRSTPEYRAKHAAQERERRKCLGDHIRAVENERYHKNRDKIRAQRKARYEADKERMRELDRRRYPERAETLKAALKERYAADPAFRKSIYWRNIENKYGLTRGGWTQLFDSQSGKCAGCSDALKLDRSTQVDHCHTTGKVRGLLCGGCNRALAGVRDRIAALEGLITYLRKA